MLDDRTESEQRIDPSNRGVLGSVYFNGGNIYRDLGKYEEAINNFMRAIRILPNI